MHDLRRSRARSAPELRPERSWTSRSAPPPLQLVIRLSQNRLAAVGLPEHSQPGGRRTRHRGLCSCPSHEDAGDERGCARREADLVSSPHQVKTRRRSAVVAVGNPLAGFPSVGGQRGASRMSGRIQHTSRTGRLVPGCPPTRQPPQRQEEIVEQSGIRIDENLGPNVAL